MSARECRVRHPTLERTQDDFAPVPWSLTPAAGQGSMERGKSRDEARATMLKDKRLWVSALTLALLYAVTWVGGWISYARELHDRTEAGYSAMRHADEAEEAAALRAGVKPHRPSVHPDGPKSGVYWCIPLLPGVLLANSHESIGPLYGQGGTYIVVYYGFGCKKVCMLAGWLA